MVVAGLECVLNFVKWSIPSCPQTCELAEGRAMVLCRMLWLSGSSLFGTSIASGMQ